MKFLKQSSWMFKEIWLIPHPPPHVCWSRREEEELSPNMILWGRNVYPVDDIEGLDGERLTRMTKQLEDAEDHA